MHYGGFRFDSIYHDVSPSSTIPILTVSCNESPKSPVCNESPKSSVRHVHGFVMQVCPIQLLMSTHKSCCSSLAYSPSPSSTLLHQELLLLSIIPQLVSIDSHIDRTLRGQATMFALLFRWVTKISVMCKQNGCRLRCNDWPYY